MKVYSLTLAILFAGCARTVALERQAHSDKPAEVQHPIPESGLSVVRLSMAARERLAIQTASVELFAAPVTRVVAGEVISPPGTISSVTAPVAGTLRPGGFELKPGVSVRRGDIVLHLVPFAPIDRDIHARVKREQAAAHAQLTAAEARVERLKRLQAEQASSQRLFEEAVATRDIAHAEQLAADTRARTIAAEPLLSDATLAVRAPISGTVRVLSALPGQSVATGTPLLEIVGVAALHVRVPIYAGDLSRLDLSADAQVRSLARTAAPLTAAAIAGPPTFDATAISVDHYYALPEVSPFVLGERVLVELPLSLTEPLRSVPAAAVVRDAQGAAWVYACDGEGSFSRRRVDPLRKVADRVVFGRGPELATCVASIGAAELFGAEFEPGH